MPTLDQNTHIVDPSVVETPTLVASRAVPIWFLHGVVTNRTPALAEFKDTAGGALMIGSPIFREGVDIPQLDALVIGGGGLSDSMVLQEVGRSLRRRPDKPTVFIYDVLDGPSKDSLDYLTKHTLARMALYKKEGFSQEKYVEV